MNTIEVAQPVAASRPNLHARLLSKTFENLFHLQSTDTTEVILVRHAEADYRSADPIDPPLADQGRDQALRLAMRLRSLEIDAIYTSTMRRALETASAIAASTDQPVMRTPQIREIAFDITSLNGKAQDPENLASEMVLRFLNNPRWDAMRGFEPSRQFRQRVIQAIEAIVAHHPRQRVVVVTHAGVINAYLSMILDIGRDMFFLPEHTSLSVVRVLGDLYAVQNLNDYAHLSASFMPS